MLAAVCGKLILHGLKAEGRRTHIRICGEGYRELLRITIEDNGCGNEPGTARDSIREVSGTREAKRSVWIWESNWNVIMRMKMYYGEDFRAELWTEEGKGTVSYSRYMASTDPAENRYPFDKKHTVLKTPMDGGNIRNTAVGKQKIGGNTRILIAEDELRAMLDENLITSISPIIRCGSRVADGRQALKCWQQKPEVVYRSENAVCWMEWPDLEPRMRWNLRAELVLPLQPGEEFEVAREAIILAYSIIS